MKVSNRVVVGFLNFSKNLSRPFAKRNKLSVEEEERLRKHLDNGSLYIEDQSSYTDVVYGSKTMQWSGCGVFATYNTLVNLNIIYGINVCKNGTPETSDECEKKADVNNFGAGVDETHTRSHLLQNLIRDYERNGIVFSGSLGTSPLAIKKYFDRHGFKTVISYRATEFDRIGEECRGLILVFYPNKYDIGGSAHFVSITKENGKYSAHNVYCDGSLMKGYDNISEIIASINSGKAKGLCLIGIN